MRYPTSRVSLQQSPSSTFPTFYISISRSCKPSLPGFDTLKRRVQKLGLDSRPSVLTSLTGLTGLFSFGTFHRAFHYVNLSNICSKQAFHYVNFSNVCSEQAFDYVKLLNLCRK